MRLMTVSADVSPGLCRIRLRNGGNNDAGKDRSGLLRRIEGVSVWFLGPLVVTSLAYFAMSTQEIRTGVEGLPGVGHVRQLGLLVGTRKKSRLLLFCPHFTDFFVLLGVFLLVRGLLHWNLVYFLCGLLFPVVGFVLEKLWFQWEKAPLQSWLKTMQAPSMLPQALAQEAALVEKQRHRY